MLSRWAGNLSNLIKWVKQFGNYQIILIIVCLKSINESTLKTKKLAIFTLFDYDKSIKNNDDILTKIWKPTFLERTHSFLSIYNS